MYEKMYRELCTPAKVYFVLSLAGLLLSVLYNMNTPNKYTLGQMTINVRNNLPIFIVKSIAIIFWTWLLSLMCKDGQTSIAWALVLFPFIVLFFSVAYAYFM